MKEEILALLQENLPDIDFTVSDKLVDEGILESVSMVEIITMFTMEYGITIPYEEIVAENFNSIDAMAAMVERLR